jgi:general stress protein YciG/hemerythrin-like domain-containing protein
MAERSKRGFAAMASQKQREIARRGGQAAHKKGTAHEFTSEEARVAGHRGGSVLSRDRQYMSEIGRKGGHSSAGQRAAKARQIQEGNGSYGNTELSGMNERTALKATEMLRGDHRKVEALFAQYETANGEHSQKETLIKQICRELNIHTRLEEEIFYPIIQVSLTKEGEQLIAEATNAHETIKNIIGQLSSMISGEVSRDAAIQQLKQWVKHHVEEEEKEMLPKAEQQLSDQLESLGARLQQYRQRLYLKDSPRLDAKCSIKYL